VIAVLLSMSCVLSPAWLQGSPVGVRVAGMFPCPACRPFPDLGRPTDDEKGTGCGSSIPSYLGRRAHAAGHFGGPAGCWQLRTCLQVSCVSCSGFGSALGGVAMGLFHNSSWGHVVVLQDPVFQCPAQSQFCAGLVSVCRLGVWRLPVALHLLLLVYMCLVGVASGL